MNNSLVQRKMALNKANLPVSYLTEDDIGQLRAPVSANGTSC